jgi:hypothetical protein
MLQFYLSSIGSILAMSISTAKSTNFYYDNNNNSYVYSTIIILSANSNLYLLDIGYKVYVKKSSVVFFLAN